MQQGNGSRNRGGNTSSRGRNNQNLTKGRGRNNDKSNKLCDYCNVPGHTRETCFQLNGFLDWYQQYKAQKESANVTKTKNGKTTPIEYINNTHASQDSMTSILQGLQKELDKLKGQVHNEGHAVNLAQDNECASNITKSHNIITIFHAASDDFEKLSPNSWIIDTRATTHMCANPKIFSELKQTTYNVFFRLPDNRTKQVSQEGNVSLSPKVLLKNVV